MRTYASAIIGNGGEGVILRKPFSLYEHGKSHSLLKFKAMIDMEAVVLRIDRNKCICKLTSSKIVVAVKKHSLFVKNGDIVSLFAPPINNRNTTQRTTQKNNYLHKIVCVRNDLRWEDAKTSGAL